MIKSLLLDSLYYTQPPPTNQHQQSISTRLIARAYSIHTKLGQLLLSLAWLYLIPLKHNITVSAITMTDKNAALHNATLLEDPDLCTIDICPLSMANMDYVPSLGGNLVFIAVFGLVLIGLLGIGIRYKTWSYMIAMTGGLLLEIIGYVARVQMHDNPFKSDPFLM
jgi:hypothetical protein